MMADGALYTLTPPAGWAGSAPAAAAQFCADYELCHGTLPAAPDAAAPLALRLPAPLRAASLAAELGSAWEGWALAPPPPVRLLAAFARGCSGAPPDRIVAWAARVRGVALQHEGGLRFSCSSAAGAAALAGGSHRVLGQELTFAVEGSAGPGLALPAPAGEEAEAAEAPSRLNLSWALVLCSFSLLLLVESRWGGWGGGGGGGGGGSASASAAGGRGALFHHRASPPRPAAHVYLDIGSNSGLSALRFLGVPGVDAVYDASTPSREGATWHVALVEANPTHVSRLEAMARDIADLGHSAEVFAPYAVAPVNGTNATFFLDNWQAGTYAATTVPGVRSSSGETLTVPTLSLQYLCGALVLGGLREEDYVVVKVDVEGAEYDVLLGAIEEGVPRLWDELYVEWHEDNQWVLRGTPLEAPAREKHARIAAQLAERFPRLKVGAWDRARRRA
jgi:FkbM family methyltransferase